MIDASDCELECSCRQERWELVDLIAMEPQEDGSTLVTLERSPRMEGDRTAEVGVRYQLRLRRGSLMARAKLALVEDDDFRPLAGAVSRPLKEVHAEVVVRGMAAAAPDSGIYLTTQVLPAADKG